jgi:hypothetical protein
MKKPKVCWIPPGEAQLVSPASEQRAVWAEIENAVSYWGHAPKPNLSLKSNCVRFPKTTQKNSNRRHLTMEAMSVESLILSAWEEEGYVGRTRVPLGMSDVDVLAVNANKGSVRVGESKVRNGSQFLYILDFWDIEHKISDPKDMTCWLEEWSTWLENLPKLWDSDGHAVVPWVFHADAMKEFEVHFCSNVEVFGDPQAADLALQRAAEWFLRKNPCLQNRVANSFSVHGRFLSTIEVVFQQIESVCVRIEEGYGRRFGDPIEDVIREMHRYLRTDLGRIPLDYTGKKLSKNKEPFAAEIRKRTALKLLQVLGIKQDEMRQWVADRGGNHGSEMT